MRQLARSDPIGVVGAGTMGSGIALVAAVAGHPVVVVDDDGAARQQAVAAIAERLERDAARGLRGGRRGDRGGRSREALTARGSGEGGLAQ